MIRAKIQSNDFVYQVPFDAIPYFKQAEDGDIYYLSRQGWCPFEPKEVIVLCRRENSNISDVIIYCALEDVKYEVKINKTDALLWLKNNREEAYNLVLDGMGV